MIDDGMPVGDPKDRQITALRAEVEDLGNRLHHVHRLWANNEHALRAEVERFKVSLSDAVRQPQEQANEITALRAEVERLRSAHTNLQHDIQQTLGRALGYPWFKNDQKNFPGSTEADGVCVGDHVAESLADEAADKIAALRAENKRLRADLRLAVTSDSEYCATIDRINAALLDAPTVDIDVVVPDRDYSTMTPKDCYEAGLLDGVYQAREAIKAAARAALEEK